MLPNIIMVYLINKKIGNNKFLYLVKNIRVGANNWKKITLYVGKEGVGVDKKRLIFDNLTYFVEKELALRKEEITNLDISYDKTAILKIEHDSIKIWNLIKTDDNEEKKIMNDFAIEFIYESNSIEGSKIPKIEVRRILEKQESKYKNRNEVKEVENAVKTLKFLDSGFSFSEQGIKKLYHILTKDISSHENNPYPKGYKKVSNIIGESTTSSPKDVPKEMNRLIKWYKENKNKMHPLQLAFEFHLRFEAIHPFLDGNGRVGRLIMNKILMVNQYPQIIIYKDNRLAYFNAITKGREGSSKTYNTFMLHQYQKTILGFYKNRLSL